MILALDVADLEGSAEAIYRLARRDTDTPIATPQLAFDWLGRDAIEVVPRHRMRAPAASARVNGRPRIFVREGLDAVQLNFFVGHELAEEFLRREGYAGEDIEHAANYLGAALVAPRRAFIASVRDAGEDWREHAARFVATESLCVLRYGEIARAPLSLVTPALVRVRGPESFIWPDEQTLRRWASGRAPRGLVKARLRDDRRRVVLRAEGDDQG